MLQFDFSLKASNSCWQAYLSVFALLLAIGLWCLSPNEPAISDAPATKLVISKPMDWINLSSFRHFISVLEHIRLSEVFVQKLVISSHSITVSGLVEQQLVFAKFWQGLRVDKQVNRLDLLHWYGVGRSYHFDVKVDLK